MNNCWSTGQIIFISFQHGFIKMCVFHLSKLLRALCKKTHRCIQTDCPVHHWNEEHPQHRVMPGHAIIAVNGAEEIKDM